MFGKLPGYCWKMRTQFYFDFLINEDFMASVWTSWGGNYGFTESKKMK